MRIFLGLEIFGFNLINTFVWCVDFHLSSPPPSSNCHWLPIYFFLGVRLLEHTQNVQYFILFMSQKKNFETESNRHTHYFVMCMWIVEAHRLSFRQPHLSHWASYEFSTWEHENEFRSIEWKEIIFISYIFIYVIILSRDTYSENRHSNPFYRLVSVGLNVRCMNERHTKTKNRFYFQIFLFVIHAVSQLFIHSLQFELYIK